MLPRSQDCMSRVGELPSRFYKALGGQPVCERLELTGGVEVKDVAYGWLDARTLIDVQERQPHVPGA
jgi:hypothetical protein